MNATKMPQEQTIQMASRSSQVNEKNMSETKPLIDEIRTREASIDRWNTAQIAFLILTAIAASGLVVTSIVLSSKGRKLSNVQEELSDIKDRNAASHAKNIDLQIAEAQRIAAEANQKAEEERLARIKIEEKLAARRLSPEQRSNIVGKLKQFVGVKLNFLAYSGDPEVAALAEDIRQQKLSLRPPNLGDYHWIR
jgi:hypothetical protein